METNSPASTNGASAFSFGETESTIQIFLPSHANLLGYAGENLNFETVQLDFVPRTMLLTHQSATAAFAVFRQDCYQNGVPVPNYQAWLKAALASARLNYDRLKEEGIVAPGGATISL
jgi:hypothetical protein